MANLSDGEELLRKENQRLYEQFSLNDDKSLDLLDPASAPGITASGARYDTFTKIYSHDDKTRPHIKFIKKGRFSYSPDKIKAANPADEKKERREKAHKKPHAFLWQTTAETLKKATRWGIVRTQSVTSSVISALGKYRVTSHQRVAKGFISNSQLTKLKLLDIIQDRFEALQRLESMVNKSNTQDDYRKEFKAYIATLEKLKIQCAANFADCYHPGIDKNTILTLQNDIDGDIARARDYLAPIDKQLNRSSLSHYNRSRGTHSIIEFVKTQMIHGLYELQGLNQDITYHSSHAFALTRGTLNDLIEDAIKLVRDHEPPERNAVTPLHHGLYSEDPNAHITYDFSQDALSPANQRDVLLAISFIEGWDKIVIEGDKAWVYNSQAAPIELEGGAKIANKAPLKILHATKWKTHRNWKTALKSLAYFIFNIVSGLFLPRHPWAEEAWQGGFHLTATTTLRHHVPPNEPLLYKPFIFLQGLYYIFKDFYYSLRDFGGSLVIMPRDLFNDWASTTAPCSLEETLKDVQDELDAIKKIEAARLSATLHDLKLPRLSDPTSRPALVAYPLTPVEQNDILTALARGMNGFGDMFSHAIFAKDPVGGLVFTASYVVAAAAILMPQHTALYFGQTYVDTVYKLAYSMTSSKAPAAMAAGSTVAQMGVLAWDGLMHGPSGVAIETFYQVAEDPLTSVAYFMAAFGLGYVLANGIHGHPIPVLSQYVQEELGTSPQTGYPVFGAKFAFALYEAFARHKEENFSKKDLQLPNLSPEDLAHADILARQYELAYWLSLNAHILPKLSYAAKFNVSRQIEQLFNHAEAVSLKKLLYPEQHVSIAYQLFTVPFSYIPLFLRTLIAVFIITPFAYFHGHELPTQPAKRATRAFIDKVSRDLARLIPFTIYILYIPYNMVVSIIKALVYTGVLLAGRIAARFDISPAHHLHQVFAKMYVTARWFGEFLYPAKAAKSVVAAHPTYTIGEIEKSYVKMLQTLKAKKEREQNPSYSHLSQGQLFHTGRVFDPVTHQNRPQV